MVDGYLPIADNVLNAIQHIECTPLARTILSGGANVMSQDAASMTNNYCSQSGNNNGDSFEWKVSLGKGTWTLFVMALQHANSGKVDWKLGSTSILAGQDWYTGAGPTYNVIQSQTGIVVPSAATYSLNGTLNGKNASSGGFNFLCQLVWMTRTGN